MEGHLTEGNFTEGHVKGEVSQRDTQQRDSSGWITYNWATHKYTLWWNTHLHIYLIKKKCYLNHQTVNCLIDKASKVTAII